MTVTVALEMIQRAGSVMDSGGSLRLRFPKTGSGAIRLGGTPSNRAITQGQGCGALARRQPILPGG
jgi:hypothetical protein